LLFQLFVGRIDPAAVPPHDGSQLRHLGVVPDEHLIIAAARPALDLTQAYLDPRIAERVALCKMRSPQADAIVAVDDENRCPPGHRTMLRDRFSRRLMLRCPTCKSWKGRWVVALSSWACTGAELLP